ncbi:DUF1796 family putative cysteine peptidase [Priestia megaterium]|uniref:DUF1796 family putative cysteine peptidase n=1 Tax=Priestia megaterium TaxID=1404 RepID=UPI002DB7386D|nr:DUF1796 family putative cysteine peptidase [Priestia megaterium]MEC1071971.1 DUF1796 family putative cysteine peptidase [Priestia megaterium]
MNLQDIKGSYNLIVSLGSACNPALQLNRLNLRSFTSGPLDWSYSPFLSDVSELLHNKFDGFMEIDNMRLIDDTGSYAYIDDKVFKFPNQNIHVQKKSYIIQDTRYNIFSAHDFPILQNKHWTSMYPKFKRNLDYRVSRFMKRMINSESILFIRWVAQYEETVKLQSILSKITKGNFKILILNPIDNLQCPVEINWEIDKVCTVNVPIDPNSISTWDYVLNGITLTH